MEKYNGYANRETWLVTLWIDNEQSSIDFWIDVAKHHYNIAEDRKHFTRKEDAIVSFSEDMKQWYEDHVPDSEEIGGLWSDMLNNALWSVDWYELAQKYMAQALENVEV